MVAPRKPHRVSAAIGAAGAVSVVVLSLLSACSAASGPGSSTPGTEDQVLYLANWAG
jgi:hypothetical protein